MRIVATSDTHFPVDPDMFPKGDLLVVAGDIMYTGYVDEWMPIVRSFGQLDGYDKGKILIPGNHDFHIENYEGVARAELRNQAGFRIYGTRPDTAMFVVGGIKFLAIPYVTGLSGWAFNRGEEQLYDYLMALGADQFKPDVVISHAPMLNVLDAIRPEQTDHRKQEHVGGLAVNRWFHGLPMESRPKVFINGHIHESYGRVEHEGTIFYNVAMCDREYKQVNPPMVIDLC